MRTNSSTSIKTPARRLSPGRSISPRRRLFHYYRNQSISTRPGASFRSFRIRKEAAQAPWTAAELNTLAKLFDSVNDYDEVIRYAFALYSLPGADQASAENALAQIIATLLKAPEQPIRLAGETCLFTVTSRRWIVPRLSKRNSFADL